MNPIIKMLYDTNTFKVSSANNPFWYTSGTVGPYYVNTHFLYDGETDANHLLSIIDDCKDDFLNCPHKLDNEIKKILAREGIFKQAIDIIVDFVKENCELDEIDYIAGGERRDWFFSIPVANILKKSQLIIYKNLTVVEYKDGETQEIKDLSGKKVLHIADLLNQASSYIRGWIPAIRDRGGELVCAVNVLDRNQGGSQKIEDTGVKVLAVAKIDQGFLDQSLKIGYLKDDQYQLLSNYIKDPQSAMQSFMDQNPEFIKEALNSDDAKTATRAKMCLDQKIYNFPSF